MEAPTEKPLYREVPFWRRRWVWLTALVVLTPAVLPLVLTGPLYSPFGDRARPMGAAGRAFLVVSALLAIALVAVPWWLGAEGVKRILVRGYCSWAAPDACAFLKETLKAMEGGR